MALAHQINAYAEEDASLSARFEEAALFQQHLPREMLSSVQQLKLYALTKQARGPAPASPPAGASELEQAKWEAWNDARPLSQQQAMESFCKIIEGLVAIIAPPDDDVIEPEASPEPPPPAAAPRCGANGAGIGPAWTRGEIERPAGSKDMGGWTAAVYTPEQQARLGVDEVGDKPYVSPLERAAPCGSAAMGGAGGGAASGAAADEEEPPVDATNWSTSALTLQPGTCVSVPLVASEPSLCTFSFSVPGEEYAVGFELAEGAEGSESPPLYSACELAVEGSIEVEAGLLRASLDNSYSVRDTTRTSRVVPVHLRGLPNAPRPRATPRPPPCD